MKLSDAIKLMSKWATEIAIPFGPSVIRDRGYAVLQIVDELLSARKREREIFKAMRKGCCWYDRRSMCHKDKDDGPSTLCVKSVCPLLAGKKARKGK